MQNEELSMQRLSGDEESGDEPQPVAVVPAAAQEDAKPDSASGGAKRRRVMHVPNLDVGRPNQPNNAPTPGNAGGEPIVCLEVKEVIPVDNGQAGNNIASGSCIGYALVVRNPDEGAIVVEELRGYANRAVEPEDPNNEESDSASGPSNEDDASAKPGPAEDDEKEMILEEIMKCIVEAYDRAVSIPDQK